MPYLPALSATGKEPASPVRVDIDLERLPAMWTSGSPQKTRQLNKLERVPIPKERKPRSGETMRTAQSCSARRKAMHDEVGRKVESAVEARAGFLDRPVLVVLCVSLALGVAILGVLWFGFFSPSAQP
jgi:hypothetical protein